MEIVKKCEWCHKTFIGQMVTARFCSSKCCDQAYRYKRKVQSGKYNPADSSIDLSTLSRRVNERKHLNESQKDKQFLSPSEAAKLLGVCRSTIYNYLWHQDLKAKQFRGKTIIRRSDIEKLFDDAPSYKKRVNIQKGKKTQNDYYSLKEMMEKFKISKRTVFRRCDQFGIPKIVEGRKTLWKKTDVDVHFAELLVQYDLKDWYNAQQIEDIYGMKRSTLNKYALRHNVPRIQFQNITYYSKSHIDNQKRLAKIPDGNYYTVQDIVKNSSFSTFQVRYYAKNEEMNVKRVNGLLLILKTDWDTFAIKYQASHLYEAPKTQEPNPFYTVDEIIKKYKVKETTIYRIAKAQNIDVFTIGNKKCLPKAGIDNYFVKDNPTPELTEWYTSEEIQAKYNMTHKQVTTFVCKHHIPRKYVGTKPYYSKKHVDKEKNMLQPEDDFKTVEELMDMYKMTVHQVREVILRSLVRKSFLSKDAKNTFYERINQLVEDLKADPLNIELQQQVEQLTEKVAQLQAVIERRKQQREQDQKVISALRDENKLLRNNNEQSATLNEKAHKVIDDLRKENLDLKCKAYPERYVLPSFIDVEATRIFKDKQGMCHITMKFTGGSKEYNVKMSQEDFVAFKNGSLTKEEVIAKYHKPRIEAYIQREFSRPDKRSDTLFLIERTIFSYMKLYSSSAFVPSSNSDNNNHRRRNYDDIDNMNDEERKGMAYK